jgi:hypothetical protein
MKNRKSMYVSYMRYSSHTLTAVTLSAESQGHSLFLHPDAMNQCDTHTPSPPHTPVCHPRRSHTRFTRPLLGLTTEPSSSSVQRRPMRPLTPPLQVVCGVCLDRLLAVVAVVEGAHRGGREGLQYVRE